MYGIDVTFEAESIGEGFFRFAFFFEKIIQPFLADKKLKVYGIDVTRRAESIPQSKKSKSILFPAASDLFFRRNYLFWRDEILERDEISRSSRNLKIN